MKIAYLITAYHQYEHLKKLITALDDELVSFFIHIDAKSKMPKNIEANNITFISRIPIWWGGWSHQKAILNLMHTAHQQHFDYYVLLSGSDYPIRPNGFLYKKLKEGGEFINVIKGFQTHKPESRIKYFHYDCFDRRNPKSLKTRFFKALEKYQRKFRWKKKYPFKEIFHGSTWWALSHNCISFILDYEKNNSEFVDFYKTSWCSEESFIPTILGNSHFLNQCRGYLTYVDWSINPAPAKINKEHIEEFKKREEFEGTYGSYSPFFARKFGNGSDELIEEIERELR